MAILFQHINNAFGSGVRNGSRPFFCYEGFYCKSMLSVVDFDKGVERFEYCKNPPTLCNTQSRVDNTRIKKASTEKYISV